MVIYSVSVAVDRDVAEEWQLWMSSVHIPDVMSTGFFRRYTFARDFEQQPEDRIAYRIDYIADSLDQYEQYRQTSAARLQSEHTERYVGRSDASRQLLTTVAAS